MAALLDADGGIGMELHSGFVKSFDKGQRTGFLGQDQGPDVFVSFSAVQMDGYQVLKEGDVVSFEVVAGSGGPEARQVVVLGKPSCATAAFD